MKKPTKKTNLNDYKTYLATSEDNGFQMLSHAIARNTFLSDGAKSLFIYLNSHSKEAFNFSRESIANYLNKSIDTIKREMNELKKHGYLKLEKKPNSNNYYYVLKQTPKYNDLPDFKTETLFKAFMGGLLTMNDLKMMNKKGVINNKQYDQIEKEIMRIQKIQWIKKGE